MLHAVVMAGGSGTRFWPISRESNPKQMLNLVDDRSLLQATVDRVGALVPREQLLVATSALLAPKVREQLHDLPANAVLSEPCKRDTAPCIGLAAMLVARVDANATMLVLPADHVIRDQHAFHAAVRRAAALVDENNDRLVTFGIRPTYPAEIFGYLERGAAIETAHADSLTAYRVVRFREKPQAQVARQYLAAGNYFWNSGIFVWKASTILQALAEHQSEMYARLETIAAEFETIRFDEVFAREFAAIRGISIDFAVMEHARDVVMLEAPFDWDDLGSWQAMARQRGADSDGNTVVGDHLAIDTADSIIYNTAEPQEGRRHLVVTVGLSDLIVVHTPDATLVANRNDEESLRKVVKLLGECGLKEYL